MLYIVEKTYLLRFRASIETKFENVVLKTYKIFESHVIMKKLFLRLPLFVEKCLYTLKASEKHVSIKCFIQSTPKK